MNKDDQRVFDLMFPDGIPDDVRERAERPSVAFDPNAATPTVRAIRQSMSVYETITSGYESIVEGLDFDSEELIYCDSAQGSEQVLKRTARGQRLRKDREPHRIYYGDWLMLGPVQKRHERFRPVWESA